MELRRNTMYKLLYFIDTDGDANMETNKMVHLGAPVVMDALPLEYKLKYGTARRNADVSNVVNNPIAVRVSSVFSFSFPEKRSNLISGD